MTGPDANASRPFPLGQRPIQCFKCRGWGHVKRLCPSQLNYTRGECQNPDSSLPKTGVHRNVDSKSQTDPVIAKAMKQADRYYNPDPLIRLIGLVNESEVLIENKSVTVINRQWSSIFWNFIATSKEIKITDTTAKSSLGY